MILLVRVEQGRITVLRGLVPEQRERRILPMWGVMGMNRGRRGVRVLIRLRGIQEVMARTRISRNVYLTPRLKLQEILTSLPPILAPTGGHPIPALMEDPPPTLAPTAATPRRQVREAKAP
jgi:hypothetical protein